MTRHKHSRILLPDDLGTTPATTPFTSTILASLVDIGSFLTFKCIYHLIFVIFSNPYSPVGPLVETFAITLPTSPVTKLAVPTPFDLFNSAIGRFVHNEKKVSYVGYLAWLVFASLVPCLLIRLDQVMRDDLKNQRYNPQCCKEKKKGKKNKKKNKDKNRQITTTKRELLISWKEIGSPQSSSSVDFHICSSSSLPFPFSTKEENYGLGTPSYTLPEYNRFLENGTLDESNDLFEIDDPYEDSELVIIIKQSDIRGTTLM